MKIMVGASKAEKGKNVCYLIFSIIAFVYIYFPLLSFLPPFIREISLIGGISGIRVTKIESSKCHRLMWTFLKALSEIDQDYIFRRVDRIFVISELLDHFEDFFLLILKELQ